MLKSARCLPSNLVEQHGEETELTGSAFRTLAAKPWLLPDIALEYLLFRLSRYACLGADSLFASSDSLRVED